MMKSFGLSWTVAVAGSSWPRAVNAAATNAIPPSQVRNRCLSMVHSGIKELKGYHSHHLGSRRLPASTKIFGMSSAGARATLPPAPTYFPLVLIVCAVAAGITLDRLHPLASAVWLGTAVAATALWLLLWLAHFNRLASTLLLAGFFAAGGAHHHDYWRLFGVAEIGRSVDEILRPAVIEAVAITSPRWVPAPPPTPLRTIPQGEHCELIVKVTAIRDGR